MQYPSKSIPRFRENVASNRNAYVAGAELCSYLGVSRTTLWKMVKAGLPSYRVGRKRKFRYSEIDHYLTTIRSSSELNPGKQHE